MYVMYVISVYVQLPKDLQVDMTGTTVDESELMKWIN